MASKSFQSFGMVDDSNVNKRCCCCGDGGVVGAAATGVGPWWGSALGPWSDSRRWVLHGPYKQPKPMNTLRSSFEAVLSSKQFYIFLRLRYLFWSWRSTKR